MIAPLLIIGAVGLLPLARKTRYLTLAALAAACLADGAQRFPGAGAGSKIPISRRRCRPFPAPTRTNGGDDRRRAHGFYRHHPAAPQIAVLRIDGWMVQPRDGTRMTRDMMRGRVGRGGGGGGGGGGVARHLAGGGDLYLIADAADMGRAHDALADYRLAIRWSECQQFDTNLIGTYQWCPLSKKP